MRRIIFFVSILISALCNAQESKMIVDRSSVFKATEILVKGFEIKQAETAYDLAVNLSYFHSVSHKLGNEYLILPIVTINGKSVEDDSLKKVSISEISEYHFRSGDETIALYGTRGKYGLLDIVLPKENKWEKHEE